jgi:hypothetical protein
MKRKMTIQESRSGIVCFPQSASPVDLKHIPVDFSTVSFLPEDNDEASFLDEYKHDEGLPW